MDKLRQDIALADPLCSYAQYKAPKKPLLNTVDRGQCESILTESSVYSGSQRLFLK